MASDSQSNDVDKPSSHSPSTSESDRGTAVSTTDKPEVNIFKSIGTFIDSQISSALQSVIGIPSAMSKSGGGGRWMVYDEAARKRQEEEMGKWGGAGPGGQSEGNDDKGKGPETNEGQQSKRMMRSDKSWDRRRDEDAVDDRTSGWWNRGDRSSRWQKHGGCHRYKANQPVSEKEQSGNESDPQQSYPYRRRHFDPFGNESSFPFLIPPFLAEDDEFSLSSPSLFSMFHSHPFFSTFHDSASIAGPAWPIPYLLFSPYSPLYLEQTMTITSRFRPMSESSSKSTKTAEVQKNWRDAFEDLMRTEMGKEMVERSRKVESGQQKEEGSEWIKALIERGSLGDWKIQAQPKSEVETDTLASILGTRVEEVDQDELPNEKAPISESKYSGSPSRVPDPYSHTNPQPTVRFNTEDTNPATEEDMYEHIFRSKDSDSSQHVPTLSSSTRLPPPTQDVPVPKDSTSIVSTLTTTTRTTMPDGSVQTKVILKKRFGDGREEVKETEHLDYKPNTSTTQEQSVREIGSGGIVEKVNDLKKTERDKKKGGWFWN